MTQLRRLWAWLRGEWGPGKFPVWSPLLIQLVLGFQLVIRGFDYLAGDSPRLASTLSIVERTIPLPLWGLGFLLSAATLFTGIILARSSMVALGHFLAAAAYVAIGYGLVRSSIELRGFDGIRSGTGLVGAGMIHFLFGIGTMWRKAADEARASIRASDPIR